MQNPHRVREGQGFWGTALGWALRSKATLSISSTLSIFMANIYDLRSRQILVTIQVLGGKRVEAPLRLDRYKF